VKSALWKPFTQMRDLDEVPDLVIARGEGRWLVTEDGRHLYDGVSSLWCNIHGHRVPAIDQAIRRQLGRIAHTTLLGATHRPAEDLARRLVDLAPKGLTRVFYSDNGSTAAEVALKMAFQYHRQKPKPEPRRTRFLALSNAYDGDTLGAVGVGGIPLFHRIYGSLVKRAVQVPPGDLDALDKALKRHGRQFAAFVFEPLVQGAAGMHLHSAAYLKEAAKRCRRHGVLLIADEVATGFGRTGRMFSCEHAGVAPDLLCLAKGITGGTLPLAATLATERIYRAFLGPFTSWRTFFHGHTYGGNPLACAAALANLDLLKRSRVVEKVVRKSELLAGVLQRQVEPLPWVKEVRQLGFMVGIQLAQPSGRDFPAAVRTGWRVCLACRRHGLLVRPLGDVVVLMPPLTATERELRWMVSVVERALREVLQASRTGRILPVPCPRPPGTMS